MEKIEQNQIKEALRYLNNAKKILKENTEVKDGFYSDAKFVKIASNTVYNGVLIALDYFADKKGLKVKNRPDKKFYQQLIGTENKKMLKIYNSLYNYLHLFGGYDGDTRTVTFKTGYQLAVELIDWIRKKYK